MPLARVTISVEAMIFVEPLTDKEKAGLSIRDQLKLIENRVEETALGNRAEIIGTEPDVDVDIIEVINNTEDLLSRYRNSIPWSDKNHDERTCAEIAEEEET